MFAVRGEVLRGLLKDPEWSAKLEKAKNKDQVIEVVEEYCISKGLKVIDV